ncbi:hypothetical protein QQF64_020601 [Cirrhinus molitorella]|uniref:DUF4371 domain-containing protein n=1 Tax=Cirrhinus molitorella TaxID=172907 RepID=A0ABR3LC77_9TELE
MAKRQLNLRDYFRQGPKTKQSKNNTDPDNKGSSSPADVNIEEEESICDDEQRKLTAAESSGGTEEEEAWGGEQTSADGESQKTGAIWTEAELKTKKTLYPWLVMEGSHLGCTVCKKVGSLGPEKSAGMKLAKEWVTCTVTSSATDLKKQQRAFRKKVFEHSQTKAHIAALSILEKAKEDSLQKTIINNLSDEVKTTARIFRTAYKEAKRHRPAYGFESEIDCQELNGLDMGRILHSNVACANIQSHISLEMKKKIFEKIVACAPKIGLMLDEATSLSRKSALIIYVRFQLPDMESPENIFVELVELEDQSAQGIVGQLLRALEGVNFTQDFLSKTLIGLSCDGASVMLGRKSGVAARLKSLFPNMIVWHCSAHRLELAVGDTMKELGEINHFRIFMDKLYTLYSTSNKNRIELKKCAYELDINLGRIGRVLDNRWVASSFRSVEAVWKNYPALYNHLSQAAEDFSRDSVTRAGYSGLAKRLSSYSFVQNLGLMYDALQELSELSLELQKQDCTIIAAHRAICREARVFEAMSVRPGCHSQISQNAVNDSIFQGVPLHSGRKEEKGMDHKVFFKSLARSLENHMLSYGRAEADRMGYSKFIEELKVLFPEYWPQDAGATYGETETESLCQQFGIDSPRTAVRALREYRENGGRLIPEGLKDILTAVTTVPISSAECERGFSQMNLICSANRASLHTSTISSLLFLCLVGPPLSQFNPIPYVRSWISKGHRTAKDPRSKARSRETEGKLMPVLWSILNN